MVLGMQQRCPCKSVPIPHREDGLEVKSGSLFMQQSFDNKTRKIPVFVRVYKNSFEHYAVIYRNQTFTNNSVYISLKNSIVSRNDGADDKEICVIPDNVEGTKLIFLTTKASEVEEWVAVLQSSFISSSPTSGSISPTLSPIIPRTPIMPTLEEMEEEDV